MQFKNKVFVSHAEKDKEIAQKIAWKLQEYPFLEIFMAPEDIKAGKFWIDELKFNVKTSDVILAILTKNYHNANWTEQEIGLAWSYGKRIVAISLDGNMGNGYIKSFQIKPFTPNLIKYGTAQLAIDLYPEIENKEEFVEGLIKYGLSASDSFNQSHAILSLCEKLVQNIKSSNSEQLINAYIKNDQVHHAIGWNNKIEKALCEADPFIQFDLEQRKRLLEFIKSEKNNWYKELQEKIDKSKKD